MTDKTIVIEAHGKVNLALDVLRRRPDGYHELRMIMQTVSLCDTLTIRATKETEIILTADSKDVPCDERNLIYRAAALMKETYGLTCGFAIHLEKRIPMAAGMAGGSADAAACMNGINELLDLQIPKEELCRLGVQIGADVPYCIIGGTVLAEGIGEKLTVLPSIEVPAVLIAKPDFDVSTKYVYENLHADTLTHHPDIDGITQDIRDKNVTRMLCKMENVLESVTERKYSEITEIKRVMKESGAKQSLMSGSGPTVFGIYESAQQAEAATEVLRNAGLAKQIHVSTFV